MRRRFALALILIFMPLASAWAAPDGAYRRSCTNAQTRGSILSAVCKGKRNRLFDTQLDIRRCGQEDIGNVFGRLTCGPVQGTVSPHSDDGDDDPQYDQPRRGYDQPRQGYSEPGYGPPRGYDYGNPDDEDDYATPRPRYRRYYDPDQDN